MAISALQTAINSSSSGGKPRFAIRFGYASANEPGWSIGNTNPNLETGSIPGGGSAELVVKQIVKAMADIIALGHHVSQVSIDNRENPKAIILRISGGEELRREIDAKDREEFMRWYMQAASSWRIQRDA